MAGPEKDRVCLIGAGVVGLSTAIILQRNGYDVTIVANASGPATTSSAAAAFWYPFWTGDRPDHSWYMPIWAERTYHALKEYLDTPEAGVAKVLLREYFTEGMAEDDIDGTIGQMWWSEMDELEYARMGPAEFESLSCRVPEGSDTIRFIAGIKFNTFVINMTAYLPFLENQFAQAGGKLVTRRTIYPDSSRKGASISSLLREYRCVINCAGAGGTWLADEPEDYMSLREGIVVKLEPSEDVKDIILMHTGPHFGRVRPFYIVPRSGPNPDILLGGTIHDVPSGRTEHYAWPVKDERVREAAEDICSTCESFAPGLAKLGRRDVSAGYRPAREIPALHRVGRERPFGVRLDPEWRAQGLIVHNYGHAGGGVTFSWGCAERVLELVERARLSGWLPPEPLPPDRLETPL